MGYKTVVQGQQALAFNDRGEGRLVIGPATLWLHRGETIEFLLSKVASQSQYLSVKDREGTITNRPGPCQMFWNRLEHERIEVKESIKLTADEMIVVYKQNGHKSERRLVYGPIVFFPASNEWLHEFQWHGVDEHDKTRWIPGAAHFNKLSTIPGQMYYNVRDVRTNDDITMRVKLMLFYQLKNTENMLNRTHDPISDFINYSEFHGSTALLSQLKTYPQLCESANRIGYEFTQVVYRGYHASERFQALQDKAIQTRTQQQLGAKIEEEKARLETFKLSKEMERTAQRQVIESKRSAQKQQLDKKQQELELKKAEMRHEAKLKREAKECQEMMAIVASEKQQEIQFLSALHDLGVDMTRYLISQQPAKVSEELQLTEERIIPCPVPPNDLFRPSQPNNWSAV